MNPQFPGGNEAQTCPLDHAHLLQIGEGAGEKVKCIKKFFAMC